MLPDLNKKKGKNKTKLLLLIGVKITEAEQAFSLSDEQEITGKLQTNHSYPPINPQKARSDQGEKNSYCSWIIYNLLSSIKTCSESKTFVHLNAVKICLKRVS